MMEPFKSIELSSGIKVDFFDHSNRYYGDFHRIKITASAQIPFDIDSIPIDLQGLAKQYNSSMTYAKDMEKMGVSSAKVSTVKLSLIDNFISTVGCYIQKDNFAVGLLRQKMAQTMSSATPRY